ncbi:MAG: hypothetical protein [Olavius algarvensis Gamma 3 endosymbiont]|nr:MAG: hypothetical protein [Olavius algarvensis Gamma 3 endosymbiont]
MRVIYTNLLRVVEYKLVFGYATHFLYRPVATPATGLKSIAYFDSFPGF